MKKTIYLSSALILAMALAPFSSVFAASDRKSRKHKGFQGQKKQYNLGKVNKRTFVVPTSKKRRPVELETFERFLQENVNIKTQEQITTLEDLIKNTPAEEKAGLYFRLAEHYWENSKYYDFEAHRYDDYRDRPEWPQKKRLQAKARTKAQANRKKAAQVYKMIINKYPKFERLCEAYYFLGKNLFEMGHQKPALTVFKQMLGKFRTKYPACPFIPNAYLSFGEYYFNKNQIRTALGSYKNVLHFRDSSIYGFALYKIAWCYYNFPDYKTALQKFVEVAGHARRNLAGGKGSKGSRIRLLKESLRDLVLAYSQIKDPSYPNNAKRYFLEHGGSSRYIKMLGTLGTLYRQQGKNEGVITVYNDLLRLHAGSSRTLLYQLYITQAIDREKSKEDTIRSAQKLAQRVKTYRQTGKKDKTYKMALIEIKAQLKEFAKYRHYEADKGRRPVYYAQAGKFYKIYLKLFPKDKSSYEMQFWYAELLYKLRRWEEAAQHYHACLLINPKGKFSTDAAYNSILAYDFLMRRSGLDVSDNRRRTATIKKKPLPRLAKQFLVACEDYIKYFPKNERSTDVSYKAALIYNNYNHFDKSLPRFYFLVKNYPRHKYAIYAAHSILDTYQIQKNWTMLHKESWRFYKQPGLGDQKFKKEVRELIIGSGMKTCEEIENRKKKYAEAARCFQKFSDEFPDRKKLALIAMNNASVNYYKAKEPKKALKIKLELIRRFGSMKSPLVKGTLLSLADIYAERADFRNAAVYYERFGEKFPADSKKAQTLVRAGVFREATGDRSRAMSHYRTVLRDKGYQQKFPKKYVNIYWKVATYHKEKEQKSQYAKMMKDFKNRRLGTPAQRIHAQMEYALIRRRQGSKGAREAAQIFKRIPLAYETLSQKQKKDYPKAGHAAAQVRFMNADTLRKEYLQIKLRQGLPLAIQRKLLAKKQNLLLKSFKEYDQVSSFKVAFWSIAVLYRKGEIYQNYSNFLYNAPKPNYRKFLTDKFNRKLRGKGLSAGRKRQVIESALEKLLPQLEDKFTMGMQQAAQPYEEKAIGFYERCLKFAHFTKVYNEWSSAGLKKLQSLRASDYPKSLEARPKAGHAASDFVYSKQIIRKLQRKPIAPPIKRPMASKKENP